MLVSPHFKQFQCFHRNVSGFASSILSHPILPEWPGPEKRPGFDPLQQTSETIYPPQEKIVWCYSQWQPAYTEMLVAMPHIEFAKGIPTALEQDSYFDVNKRSLIVFDDQMIDTSKDKRIVNLFTRGCHHRNLSCRDEIICIQLWACELP